MNDEDIQELLRERHFTEAFERLLDRYQERVFRLAFSMLRDPARAEDAAQVSFLKLWRALPRYDGRASLSTWLYAIARNTALSAIRDEARRAVVPLEHCPAVLTADDTFRNIQIRQLLERLPAMQRQAITLFYLQDRDIRETARMLDLPEGTVKSHLHRARRTMAEWMRK